MRLLRSPTYCLLLAQGATEYLVLLAVVLIVALVSVALLGFFPGMASDTQIAQSKSYWSSASPIAIIEWDARLRAADANVFPYFRVKNNGVYPVRITAIIGADGGKASMFYGTASAACGTPTTGLIYNISDFFYLGPGEEKSFIYSGMEGTSDCNIIIWSVTGSTSSAYIGGASSICQNSAASPGVLQYNNIGFEYVEYLDNNQQITKREAGKAVIIKCREPA